ncbi:DUF3892 domain-containing protein [Cystobacter fuscus]|uniref:DUF3892 domain-containing protein n=1 Tax=Cystobacter fuscus TaxID=43 RepID=UPI002B314A62|nr:DUF3892 domain-containing protein [Cystobacter fuscus]
MLYITHIRLATGANTSHEHISDVKWLDTTTRQSSQDTRAEMVRKIDRGQDVRVKDHRGDVQVLVVRANPPYLRTYADGRPTDNLLSLPRF